MATLDIFILIVLAVGLIRGFRSGLLKQVASLIGTILAFVLAASFMESAGRLLELKLGVSPEISSVTAFIGVFFLVKIAVLTVANAARSLVETAKLSGLDRLAGGLAGSFKAAILLSMPVYRLVPDAWSFISDRSPAFEDLRRRVEDRLDFNGDSLPI